MATVLITGMAGSLVYSRFLALGFRRVLPNPTPPLPVTKKDVEPPAMTEGEIGHQAQEIGVD